MTHQGGPESAYADIAIIASAPNDHSLRRFLHRGTHIILQSEPHFTNCTKAWLGKSPHPMVKQIMNRLSLHQPTPSRILSASNQVVSSCRAPVVHPYLSLRFLELLSLHPLPIPQRKMILYIKPKQNNRSWRILNEDDLLQKTRRLLDSRNKNETLVQFDHVDFESLDDMLLFFSNVAAVLGHGGALFNHRWTGQDTLVMEFVRKTSVTHEFWEEASILGQNYWAFPLDTSGLRNMTVIVDNVVDVLNRHLGKPRNGPSLEHYYPWDIEG